MIPRDDLRIGPKCGEPEPHDLECFETATDADLAAMGLVQAPECGECGGSGGESGTYNVASYAPRPKSCPHCGGSGYGRIIQLDLDLPVREAMRRHFCMCDDCQSVLAALDGEDI